MPPKLGILAGGGELPAKLIEACRATGRDFFVLAFDGHTDPGLVNDVPHAWTRLGAGIRALDHLRSAGVEELVFAGRIVRPSMRELRPDLRTARMFARLGKAAFGDDSLLSTIIKELETEGFTIVGPDSVVEELLAPAGVYGAVEPDAQAMADIARGIEVSRGIGQLDVGQAAVVQDGIVLGIEAVEGTDALLARCAGLRREGPGGVLVKTRKPQQESRIDLPTIGTGTVTGAATAGLRGIAIEAGGALIVARAAVVGAADEAGLFILGVDTDA
jgi:hypothetical protein